MINMNLLRKRLKTLRLEQGLKTSDIAAALNIDTRNYLRIERGERKCITIEELDIICTRLSIDLPDLVKEVSESKDDLRSL